VHDIFPGGNAFPRVVRRLNLELTSAGSRTNTTGKYSRRGEIPISKVRLEGGVLQTALNPKKVPA